MMLASDDAANTAQWDEVEEATELLQEERFGDALLALREVLRTSPRNPYAYHFLGVVLHETEKFEPARDAFRAAIRLSPSYLGSRIGLSHALRVLGDARSALAEANEALRRFPRDPDALHAKGLAQAALGQRAAAQQSLAGYLDTSPEAEVAEEVRQIMAMLGAGEENEPIDIE